MGTLRVLLADDSPIVAEALKELIAEEFHLVGALGDGVALVEAIDTLHPDVVLTDISMPGTDGLTALRALRARFPQVKVIMLTNFWDEPLVRHAFDCGAVGYVLKAYAPFELGDAIRAAAEGRTYVSGAIASRQAG